MHKKIIYLILIIVTTSLAGDFPRAVVLISPSVKIGYEFGKQRGIVFGGELLIQIPYLDEPLPWVGLITGFEKRYSQKRFAFYGEVACGIPFIGVSLGTEYYNKEFKLRCSILSEALFGALRYKLPIKNSSHEISLIGRAPIHIYAIWKHADNEWFFNPFFYF